MYGLAKNEILKYRLENNVLISLENFLCSVIVLDLDPASPILILVMTLGN